MTDFNVESIEMKDEIVENIDVKDKIAENIVFTAPELPIVKEVKEKTNDIVTDEKEIKRMLTFFKKFLKFGLICLCAIFILVVNFYYY